MSSSCQKVDAIRKHFVQSDRNTAGKMEQSYWWDVVVQSFRAAVWWIELGRVSTTIIVYTKSTGQISETQAKSAAYTVI